MALPGSGLTPLWALLCAGCSDSVDGLRLSADMSACRWCASWVVALKVLFVSHPSYHFLSANYSVFFLGVKDSRTLFEILLSQHGTEYLIGRFECGMFAPGSKMGLNQRSTMMQLSDHFSLKVALSWFDLVLVTLDCYTWVFGERLLSPDTIFVGMWR